MGNSHGYKTIAIKGKPIYEHRKVMEEFIGKPLNKDQVVHHKNHDKTDNSVENLEVMTKSEHARLHFVRGARVCGLCGRKKYALDLCSKHYQRFKIYGNANEPLKIFPKNNFSCCTVSGCEAKTIARGFCNKHYIRNSKFGNPENTKKIIYDYYNVVCREPGCLSKGRPFIKSFCKKHYTWRKRHGLPVNLD